MKPTAKLAPRLGLLIVMLAALAACATSDPVSPLGAGGGAGEPDPTTQSEDGICLLNNCSADEHCSACADGLNSCLLSENRCVACDRQTGEGCDEGETCSPYGKCVPTGLVCPTDAHGTPTVTCGADADCAACDPQHQVCDPATSRCVGCTAENISNCQSTDSCIDNECLANCPQDCDRDSDCASCGIAGKEAHACNAHRCAQCSPTLPCPGGQLCNAQGVCVLGCGKLNNNGKCDSDADCVGCGNEAPKCNLPINGGEGTCGPYANGCSDLGQSAAVLPAPYDQVTNLCSNDNDCAGVGVTVNVGKMLRDLTNFNSIGDANINYGMNRCANITIKNTSCGVCVPCKVDSDCKSINIDQVAADAFGPIGSLAAAFLLDQIFGPNDHKIHMYCDQLAGSYGACVPCPNWLSSCSTGGYNGGGSCGHGECQVGAALNTSCSSCAQQVCNVDSYCCNNQWDAQCVQEAEQMCGSSCGGGGGQCAHDECNQGPALGGSCSTCAGDVCNADPYCCNNSWDALCVQKVAQLCPSKSCGGGGSGSCAHDECNAGNALSSSCSTCAGVVCNVDPYCCSTAWDSQCAQEADQMCAGKSCGMGGGCGHDECSAGGKLTGSCSSCAAAVCNADPYCCTTEWDQQCVSEVGIYCSAKSCGGGGGGGSCAHDMCSSGTALYQGCSSCVSTVCGADPYCCSTQWDSQCVGEAKSMCQLSCNGGTGGNSCSHDECAEGAALTSGCSSCAASVCNADPFCCNNQWDSQCVGEAEQLCGYNCGGGGGGSSCAHDECASGGKLSSSCSSCAASVCSADPYCCNTQWDSQCVDEVDYYCSFSCL